MQDFIWKKTLNVIRYGKIGVYKKLKIKKHYKKNPWNVNIIKE